MILPNKNIRLEYSLLNCGAFVLNLLDDKDTLSSLWDKARGTSILASYEKFILTLDFLFMTGAIQQKDGLIARCKSD